MRKLFWLDGPLWEQNTRKQGEKWQFSSYVSQNALELLCAYHRTSLPDTARLLFLLLLCFGSICTWLILQSIKFCMRWEKNWVACRFSQTRSCSCRCQLLLLFFLLVLVLLYRNVLFFFFFIVVDDGWWVCCFMMWLIVACRWCDLTYSYVCSMHSSLLDLSLPHWYICWSLVLRICCC